MLAFKPRLFISYAREDEAFAGSLNAALNQAGYHTFFDKSTIKIGDVFPEKIIHALKHTDACILIISPFSVQSEWCKLEAYYAHFFRKPLIPIKLGDSDYDAESPLRSIQKNIQYATLESYDDPAKILAIISEKLELAKSNARSRILRYCLLLCSLVLFIAAVLWLGVRKINQLAYDNQKKELLSAIKTSDRLYKTAELLILRNRFNNDADLIARLHLQEADPGLTDKARLNSSILSSFLLRSFNLAKRQYFKEIQWELSTMENNLLANCTFMSGHISEVIFRNSELDNVLFNGISPGEKGIVLSGLLFDNCSLNAVEFNNNNAIDLKFRNCRFNGAVLNTTNFGAVCFFSDTANTSHVLSNGQITSFRNSSFKNDNPPDEPGVIVLGKEEEMQFIGVVFDECTFTGLVRPEWFRNCSFSNCRFPKGAIPEKLKGRNFVYND
jgi:uncharacterized protein YjbI with pentapeptide repeats